MTVTYPWASHHPVSSLGWNPPAVLCFECESEVETRVGTEQVNCRQCWGPSLDVTGALSLRFTENETGTLERDHWPRHCCGLQWGIRVISSRAVARAQHRGNCCVVTCEECGNIRASYGVISRGMWPHLAHVTLSHGGWSGELRCWRMNLISRSSWPGEVLTFFSFCICVPRPERSWRGTDHSCHKSSLDWVPSGQLIVSERDSR